jgi:hypothetical protein
MKLVVVIWLGIINAIGMYFLPEGEIMALEPETGTETDTLNHYAPCGKFLFSSGRRGLFFSEDQGKSWKKHKSFPDIKISRLSSRDTELFVFTTQYGLYYSTDCGNTWETIEQIFPQDEGMVDYLNQPFETTPSETGNEETDVDLPHTMPEALIPEGRK